jgi:hypothetical protein
MILCTGGYYRLTCRLQNPPGAFFPFGYQHSSVSPVAKCSKRLKSGTIQRLLNLKDYLHDSKRLNSIHALYRQFSFITYLHCELTPSALKVAFTIVSPGVMSITEFVDRTTE